MGRRSPARSSIPWARVHRAPAALWTFLFYSIPIFKHLLCARPSLNTHYLLTVPYLQGVHAFVHLIQIY